MFFKYIPQVLVLRRGGGVFLLVLLALLLLDLLADLVAVLLGDLVAGLRRVVGALLAHGGHARGDERLVVCVLADLPGDLAALLGVDVLLHLLGLRALLKLADLLVLVVAVLPLAHVGVPLVNSLADLIRSGAALGHDDSPGSVITAGGGRLVAFGLLVVLAVVLSVVFALAVRVLAVAVLSGAIELGRGPAGPVDDGLLLVLAVRVVDVDADILLLGRGGDVVDSIADTL